MAKVNRCFLRQTNPIVHRIKYTNDKIRWSPLTSPLYLPLMTAPVSAHQVYTPVAPLSTPYVLMIFIYPNISSDAGHDVYPQGNSKCGVSQITTLMKEYLLQRSNAV